MPHLSSLLQSLTILENRFGLEVRMALDSQALSSERLSLIRAGTTEVSPIEVDVLMGCFTLAHSLSDAFPDGTAARSWLSGRSSGRRTPRALFADGQVEAVLARLSEEGPQSASEGERVLARWSSFSNTHFVSAQALAAMSAITKMDEGSVVVGTQRDTERALSLGSLLCTVAFVEAYINELFAVAGSGARALTENLEPSLRECLRRRRLKPGFDREGTLRKYQLALRCAGVAAFEGGSVEYERISAVIYLRNAIVHFEPEWHGPIEEDPGQAAIVFSGKDLARIGVPHREPVEPSASIGDAYLCAETVRWALQAASEFVQAFCGRIGLPFQAPPTGSLRSLSIKLDKE